MQTKILIRPENFLLRYQQWQEKNRQLHLEMLRGSYANEVFGKGSDDLEFIQESRNSRIIWKPEDVGIETMSFVLEDLKNILLKNNFLLLLSDERNEIYDSGLKITIHRHYLKPEDKPQSPTIILEHGFSRNHNAFTISVLHSGNEPGIGFEKLMEVLMA